MSGMAGENSRAMGPEPEEGETIAGRGEAPPGALLAVIVAARNEADRIGATVAGVRAALPAASGWVADEASDDGTAEAALVAGAQVVSRGRPHGKGANVGAAAAAALGVEPPPATVLLCDGDL